MHAIAVQNHASVRFVPWPSNKTAATRWEPPKATRVSFQTQRDEALQRIGYLAHDLTDPAVARRVTMFRTGGADVKIAGFSRGELPDSFTDALVLGHSADARLASRALTVLRVLATGLPVVAQHMKGASAIVARNLEMLVIGQALQRRLTPRPDLVYECLDIHRLLTSQSSAGRALRRLERHVGKSVDLVLTSSPAFIANHLKNGPFANRIILVENKILTPAPHPLRLMPPPFRIGWYGALRCERSFKILADLSDRLGGKVKVSLRGRPSPAVFPDMATSLAPHPHMSFGGPYTAADLPSLYGDVHFAWCIDFYEQGANSEWLLPNRLYESAAFGAVPIALRSVETGRYLQRHGLGVTLEDANPEALASLFSEMTSAKYAALHRAVIDTDPALWRASPEDCRALVTAITQPTARAAA
ncbi:glycosyl transferase family 1 (plasmid) [Gemmobacter aquarius]|uniref:Glycosyl transferase family 1 n=1 Tax=Paragemmobacter aquarius TaxID=2169400 RepID=A0A2S0US41_9RHOB|nr:glycosyl transferase family 1 [Gemmobacter aquarius]